MNVEIKNGIAVDEIATSQQQKVVEQAVKTAIPNKSVPQNSEKARKQFSLSEDNNGNKLTDEQKEYFKDSKILDDNGNLKVMYHGSTESFTVFDKRKAKSMVTCKMRR